jgi:hypothetical protein
MYRLLPLLLSFLSLTGCLSPPGDTPEEQIVSTLEMRDRALTLLYEENPKLQQKVEESVGYAVFKSFSIHPGLFSFANGFGVSTNRLSGKETQLRWSRLTIGPGIAVKGLYCLVIFDEQQLLERFEKGPWMLFGQAEASFVFGDFGGALEAGWLFRRGMEAHYLTHTGVALELELIGLGKVSNNSELNRPAP